MSRTRLWNIDRYDLEYILSNDDKVDQPKRSVASHSTSEGKQKKREGQRQIKF
jgi:hypothetical protein